VSTQILSVAGIDIGGTFTDCVIVTSDGSWTSIKVDTPKASAASAVLAALAEAGRRSVPPAGLADVLAGLSRVVVSSTIHTNAIAEGDRERVGVITTAGFEDTLFTMRGGIGLTAGRSLEEYFVPQRLRKPAPLVRRQDVVGIAERTDARGEVLCEVQERALCAAALELIGHGISAIAICFLWSCSNPHNEERARAVLDQMDLGLPVATSNSVSNRMGEYERFGSTVLNALLGARKDGSAVGIAAALTAAGFTGDLLFGTAAGGVVPEREATEFPLRLLDAGPACGNAASSLLAGAAGEQSVVMCDMGGTTLDVSLLVGGEAVVADKAARLGYQINLPRVEVSSVGAGGGSIARLESGTGIPFLRVGPRSAGAIPGPICYGRGGTEVTVTDADLVLGYIDESRAPRGVGRDGQLDVQAAHAGLSRLGAPLGWSAEQCAAAIVGIVDGQSAELIRQLGIRKGLDLRSFTMYAYGGAGPVHAGSIAQSLGCRLVRIVPDQLSAVWSAFGAAVAQKRVGAVLATNVRGPWTDEALADPVSEVVASLKKKVAEIGAANGEVTWALFASIGFGMQPSGIEFQIPLFDAEPAAGYTDLLWSRFAAWAGRHYREESVYLGAPVFVREIRGTAEVRGQLGGGVLRAPRAEHSQPGNPRDYRDVYWPEEGRRVRTPCVEADDLSQSVPLPGPALVRIPASTIVVHPGQQIWRDHAGGALLDVAGDRAHPVRTFQGGAL
jgi:N-methylhydantoinase A